jgi:hypothetical protein
MSNNNSNQTYPAPTASATNTNQAPLNTNNNTNGGTNAATTGQSTAAISATYSNYIELENQLILRMPYEKLPNGQYKLHPATQALRDALEKSAQLINDNNNNPDAAELEDSLKDRLFIEINPDTRKGRVKFDDEVFDARLVDLPCIIESLKTIDKKAVYKTADICQMLICKTKEDALSFSDEELSKNIFILISQSRYIKFLSKKCLFLGSNEFC